MNKEINISDKEFTAAEQKAILFLQDRGYSWVGRKTRKAAEAIGEAVKGTGNVLRTAKGNLKSVKDSYKVGRNLNDAKVHASQIARNKTMRDTKIDFDIAKEKSKLSNDVKTGNMKHIVGGAAVGAVGGGAVGAGIGHLASSKSRKRIAFLETKGENLSNKERAEIVHLKGKVRNAKVIGGAVGSVAGGVAGYFGGKHLAKNNKKSLFSKYAKRKDIATDKYKKATSK